MDRVIVVKKELWFVEYYSYQKLPMWPPIFKKNTYKLHNTWLKCKLYVLYLLTFSVVISDLEQNKLSLKNMHISGIFTVFLSTGKGWDN